ncbi:MAG: hypothetical protein BKP49_09275 [Treponema sp. CETP13]|nr:MAG: hypothetical protein BKP49_09275 [Treponema sp. CETP13]
MSSLKRKNYFQNIQKKIRIQINSIIKNKFFFIIVSFLVIVFVLIIVNFTNAKTTTVSIPNTFVLEDDLIPPLEPQSVSSYMLNRTIPKKWSKQECEDLFSSPEDDLLQQIQFSNDKMIKNILRNAP